ncbi:hypothetical protein A4H97_26010 [Niastella yeongjuensis]|uniref:Uncharacterized protein n=1 Tax=Niastella yeongjuensis TaxID=354355 RepID=A0A1V9F149_9BACT|nr:hypothetical protein A4H97_26010 [Niastella yeongjuensis]
MLQINQVIDLVTILYGQNTMPNARLSTFGFYYISQIQKIRCVVRNNTSAWVRGYSGQLLKTLISSMILAAAKVFSLQL